MGLFCLCPIWRGNVNFMRHFFPNCGNPARSRSRINPGQLLHICSSYTSPLCLVSYFQGNWYRKQKKACILNVNPASWTGTYLAGIYSMSLKKLSRRYSAQQNVQLQIILQLSQTLTNPHNTASLLCVLMRKRIGLEMAYICSLYLRVQVGHNALEHKCTIHVLFFLFIWQQQKQ